MAQPHRRIVWKALPKVSADLLRTPPQAQEFGNQRLELVVGVQAAPMVACTASRGLTMSLEGSIIMPISGIAAQFA
jgi:hypothetical protein